MGRVFKPIICCGTPVEYFKTDTGWVGLHCRICRALSVDVPYSRNKKDAKHIDEYYNAEQRFRRS